MSDSLNGTEWKDTHHQVKAHTRNWDVTVRLNTGSEQFECICPALPGCISRGITPADALANMKDAIEKYLAEGQGGFKGFNGPSIRFN